MRNKITYGLALSGGGARGIAHLGVLQALTENNIQPAAISGTSMGALVAVGYGLGIQPKEMLKVINREIKPLTLSNMNMRRMGLFNLKKVEKLFHQWAPTDNFNALKIPTFITVTNLNTGHFEIKSEGQLVAFTIASASIPLLFCPVIINGTYYVDGGLTKNMAIQVLKDKCDKVIGSHVNHIAEIDSFKRMKDIAARSYHLAVFNTIRDELTQCDYIVDPPDTRNYSTLDFNKADEIFEVGYREGLLLAEKLMADEKANRNPVISRLRAWKSYLPRL